ncbi:MAG: hypothetical protein DMF86_09865 [Acidobacteria bacterium]|nr:MAG: hypothetical protein DMF86_09865 [Acidobacteriota bacterium]
MRLESAQELKQQLLRRIVEPFAAQANKLRVAGARAVATASAVVTGASHGTVFGVGARPPDSLPQIQRSIALGVAPHQGEYRLAVRVQRPALLTSPIMEQVTRQAKGEIDIRIVGRLDKRARGAATAVALATPPWYQRDTRPLLIGASVGHVNVTAGTITAFVRRSQRTYLLSNNHVLANEDRGRAGDWVLQRAAFDGGRQPAQRVARLRFWVRLKLTAANVVDCALAEIQSPIAHDAALLHGIANGTDRRLAGVGPAFVDEGAIVYKIGRTTGATEGRVTAFDVDNVVVNYDIGNLRFDGQLEIEGTGRHAFSDGGDSGSLIVNSNMQAVALLFAGGDTGGSNGLGLTYANPIAQVLKALNATLLF